MRIRVYTEPEVSSPLEIGILKLYSLGSFDFPFVQTLALMLSDSTVAALHAQENNGPMTRK